MSRIRTTKGDSPISQQSNEGNASVESSEAELSTTTALEIGKRIAIVRGHLTQKEFARSIDRNFGSINQYERGVRTPIIEVVNKICDVFNVNHRWLLAGEGPMRKSNQHEADREEDVKPTLISVTDDFPVPAVAKGFCYVDFLNADASAGPGSFLDSEYVTHLVIFKESWLRREFRARPQDLKVISVRGESMLNTLSPGDLILVDLREQRPDADGIFVLRFNGGLFVKRIQSLPGGTIKVKSDNPVYETFTVNISSLADPEEFRIIGRAVWVLAGKKL